MDHRTVLSFTPSHSLQLAPTTASSAPATACLPHGSATKLKPPWMTLAGSSFSAEAATGVGTTCDSRCGSNSDLSSLWSSKLSGSKHGRSLSCSVPLSGAASAWVACNASSSNSRRFSTNTPHIAAEEGKMVSSLSKLNLASNSSDSTEAFSASSSPSFTTSSFSSSSSLSTPPYRRSSSHPPRHSISAVGSKAWRRHERQRLEFDMSEWVATASGRRLTSILAKRTSLVELLELIDALHGGRTASHAANADPAAAAAVYGEPAAPAVCNARGANSPGVGLRRRSGDEMVAAEGVEVGTAEMTNIRGDGVCCSHVSSSSSSSHVSSSSSRDSTRGTSFRDNREGKWTEGSSSNHEDRMNAVHYCTAFHRIAKHSVKFPPWKQRLVKGDPTVRRVAEEVESAVDSLDAQSLCNVAWAHAKLGHGSPHLMPKIARAALRVVSRFQPLEVAIMMHAYGKVGSGSSGTSSSGGSIRDGNGTSSSSKNDVGQDGSHGSGQQDGLPTTEAATSATAEAAAAADCNVSTAIPEPRCEAAVDLTLSAVDSTASAEIVAVLARERVMGQWDAFNPRQMKEVAWAHARLGLPSRSLFAQMGHAVASRKEEFEMEQMAAIAWSFAKLGHHHPRLFEAIAGEMSSRVEECNSQDIANTAWAFAKLGVKSPLLMASLSSRAASSLHLFAPQAISSTAWAFATLHHRDLSFVTAVEQESLQRLPSFSSQAIANVAWALASLGHYSPPLLSAVAATLPPMLPSITPSSLACLTFAFAAFGHQAPQLFDRIAQLIISRIQPVSASAISSCSSPSSPSSPLSAFGRQTLVTITWAFIVLGHSDSPLLPIVRRHLACMEGFSSLELCQLFQVELALRLEAPLNLTSHLSLSSSPPASRPLAAAPAATAAAQLELQDSFFTQDSPTDWRLEEAADGSPSLVMRQLSNLWKDGFIRQQAQACWEAANAEDQRQVSSFQRDMSAALTRMGIEHVLEFKDASYSIDIAIFSNGVGAMAGSADGDSDSSSQSIGLPNGGSCSAAAPVRVALEADGPSHFSRSGEIVPLGATRLKERLLTRASWHVVQVPYFEWDRLQSERDKEEYLSSALRPFLPAALLHEQQPVLHGIVRHAEQKWREAGGAGGASGGAFAAMSSSEAAREAARSISQSRGLSSPEEIENKVAAEAASGREGDDHERRDSSHHSGECQSQGDESPKEVSGIESLGDAKDKEGCGAVPLTREEKIRRIGIMRSRGDLSGKRLAILRKTAISKSITLHEEGRGTGPFDEVRARVSGKDGEKSA